MYRYWFTKKSFRIFRSESINLGLSDKKSNQKIVENEPKVGVVCKTDLNDNYLLMELETLK